MASISKDKNGNRTIQFVDREGKRKSIRLGKQKILARNAEEIFGYVKKLNSAKLSGSVLDDMTAKWVNELAPWLHQKLFSVGLVDQRTEDAEAQRQQEEEQRQQDEEQRQREEARRRELSAFIDTYVESRVDVKPATKEVWRQGKLGLVKHFGPSADLAEITEGAADQYKQSMIGQELAPMTVRKRLQFAKQVFHAAVRHRLIKQNPFDGVKIKGKKGGKNKFVEREAVARIIEHCPDHHWRMIVVLCRYAGLRCPSEVLSLRWQDVDWDRHEILVTSPKTAHHAGKETRLIPLFPELRPYLDEAWELAEEGATYVIDERYRKSAMGESGWRNCNLRTTFQKIVGRAGLSTWPRLFHSLRASRQTELATEFPTYVVCQWLGNSPDIARDHYLIVRPEDFAKAIRRPLQNDAVEQALQIPVQYSDKLRRDESQTGSADCETTGDYDTSRHMTTAKTDGVGFEPTVHERVQ